MLFTTKSHRFVFLFGLALSLCALPYSPFALSVGLITIAANWLLDGCWQYKLNRFISRKDLWFFLMVYSSISIGFFYTQNILYGIKELKLWLPILIIPVIVATSKPLKRSEFKSLLLLFSFSVFVATLISFSIYVKDFSQGSQNVRAISPFISHIRLSLMVNLSIFILAFFAFQKGFIGNIYLKIVLIIIALWLVAFLFILQSLTGITILVIVLFVLSLLWISSVKDTVARFSLIVGVILIILLGLIDLAHTIDKYFYRNDVEFKTLPNKTINGNQYTHDTLSRQYENSNLVFINVCYPELSREWNRVSKTSFEGINIKGESVSLTLIRYLTSKGLKKDSVGIAQLDSIDIKLIENSVASVIYRDHKTGIYPRLYQILWEIDSYYSRGIIGGSSFVQRYIFIKASWHIIKNNLLLGVGSGDGPDAMNEYYRTSGVDLDQKYWFLSHNEYLTVWISSGIIGLVLFLVGLFYPFFFEKRYKIFLCLVFQIIIIASMLNEDTFETHIGISFAALFYSILFFGYDFIHDKIE